MTVHKIDVNDSGTWPPFGKEVLVVLDGWHWDVLVLDNHAKLGVVWHDLHNTFAPTELAAWPNARWTELPPIPKFR